MFMDIMANDEVVGETLLSNGFKTEVRLLGFVAFNPEVGLLFIDFIVPAKL
jgi:hypothetical protein